MMSINHSGFVMYFDEKQCTQEGAYFGFAGYDADTVDAVDIVDVVATAYAYDNSFDFAAVAGTDSESAAVSRVVARI